MKWFLKFIIILTITTLCSNCIRLTKSDTLEALDYEATSGSGLGWGAEEITVKNNTNEDLLYRIRIEYIEKPSFFNVSNPQFEIYEGSKFFKIGPYETQTINGPGFRSLDYIRAIEFRDNNDNYLGTSYFSKPKKKHL